MNLYHLYINVSNVSVEATRWPLHLAVNEFAPDNGHHRSPWLIEFLMKPYNFRCP